MVCCVRRRFYNVFSKHGGRGRDGWVETEMEIVSGWIGDDGCKVKHEIGTTTHHPLEVLQVQREIEREKENAMI